jgi:hypothetical protein
VQNLTALSPPQLTQLGLSSTELGHILAFARHLSSVDLAPIHLLVASQKKYEADTTRKILAANRAGGAFGPRTVTAAAPGLPHVKQTVAFKAKHASSPDAVKKFLQKAAKQTLATGSPKLATEQNVAKYSQMLGATGVTITKPGQPTASHLPRPAPAVTTAAAVVSVSEKSSAVGSHQGLTISKKFPHLTISSVDQTNKMVSSSVSSTGGAGGSAAAAPKGAPASRSLAVKAFASLHADSTNISAGPNVQQPGAGGGKVPGVVTASNSRGSPALTTGGGQSQGATASNSGRSPAVLLGQSSAGKSQGANAAGISRSPMGKPQPAAVAWKAQSNSPKTGVAGKASQQQGAKNAMGGSHSLVALRDFKAQVRVRGVGNLGSFEGFSFPSFFHLSTA